MIVPKQGYRRQYAFGGTGIFDTIGNIVKGGRNKSSRKGFG